MKRFSIVCGLILAATLAPMQAIAATFRPIVVYGDSLSDLGRASAATGRAVPDYSSLVGGGRFSNGPLWVEYLADSLGITTTPSTNFAVGGATTSGHPQNNLSPSLIGIEQQVNNNSVSDPNALYIVWGGANDYLGGITDPTVPVNNLTGAIATLIARGAKNILVPNLANLGDLPSTSNLGAVSSGLNLLTQGHNTGLAASINALRQVNPTVTLTLLDVNSLFEQVVKNPSSFGFTNVTDKCFINTTTVCTDPNSYLFWDDIHPTTAGHRLIGNLAFNAVSPSVPEPTTILGSIVAGGSIIAFKRKLKSSQLKAKMLVESD